jgi:predicted dehydrogenase
MASKKIRFAQISFWFSHARGICTTAQKHPDVDLVAIWDADTKRGQAAAEQFGVEYLSDLDELLQRDDIDAVGIASETHLHAEHIIRAAEAGKHCMVEKPFARIPEQADAAIAAVEKAGVQVMPVYNLRFSPAHERMKQAVDSGELGKITQVRRRHGHDKYSAQDFDAERIQSDPKDPWFDAVAEGRSSLQHAGSHSVFWMLWMFGMPESVVSLGVASVDGLPVEDNNACVFRYANGTLVTLHTSETETRAPLATEIYGHKGALIQVRGDHPSTKLDFGDPASLMLYTNETEAWQPLTDFHRSFVPPGYGVHGIFFDALSKGEEMPITVYEGRQCVEILVAAELAGKEKRQVELSEITNR